MKYYIIICLLIFAVILNAQDGQLDKSFNLTGKVITSVEGKNIATHDMLIQPDGKILVAGTASTDIPQSEDYAVVRYNPDGKIDSSFNYTGIRIIDFEGKRDECFNLALQKDGKIILSGRIFLANFDLKAGLVRLNEDGSFDESFGDNGKSVNNLGDNGESIKGLMIEDNGKIILTGIINSGTGNEQAAVLKYKENGTLDETFGNNGIAANTLLGYNPSFGLLQSDGKILAGGFVFENNTDVIMLRYNPNGTLDSTFGINGIVQTDYNNDEEYGIEAIIQEDNKILVVVSLTNSTGRDFCMIRYNEDGSVDKNFGVNGRVVTDFSNKKSESSGGIAIQKDQKIVLSGFTGITPNHDFAVARYNTDGSIDNDFGTAGKLTTNFFVNDDLGFAMGIQEDNKIVVAGHSVVSKIGSFAVARYLSGLEMVSTSQPRIEMNKMIVYPNPIVNEAVLEYTLNRDQVVSIGLYDISGRLVQRLVENEMRRGGHNREVLKISERMPSGNYGLVIKSSEGDNTIKLLVNR